MARKRKKNSNYKGYGNEPAKTKKKDSGNLRMWLILAAIVLVVAAVVVGSVLITNHLRDRSDYTTSRDIEGHDITYAEISVKDYGKITVLLDATTAPKTVANFIKLANEGFYDGLTFHRVAENFMIQGGCPRGDGTGFSDETVKGEFALNGYDNDISHLRGTISMARSEAYNSGSCQFFICNADYTSLDGSYAAFGYVVDGLRVVDKITKETVPYADPISGGISDKSKQAVIEYVKILEDVD